MNWYRLSMFTNVTNINDESAEASWEHTSIKFCMLLVALYTIFLLLLKNF